MAKRPFNEGLQKLKALSPPREERPRRPAPPPPPAPPAPPAEPSESELWAQATRGARPVDRGPDTVAPAAPRGAGGAHWHPDLEAIDALRALVSGDAPFDLSDSDEYIEGRVAGLDQSVVRKLRRGEFAVQGHVDLHGLTRAEAKQAVDAYLRGARQAGKRCVLVVHGRGLHSKDQLPVLKDALKTWLASARFARHVLAFATARPVDGGAGALYVLLRRPGR
ncbi:Smr/MutS family protein [Anaeromyxobacter sp. PSR-1]|uniref:Smr/MutS family protein n=1 Tax=Anaeromyxobacter sp. PSR-1 TaxID=1300915 RepID=UPI0005DD4651|nr:Smr/MutS family protein [Anaeromyxobacter sp. PSR-1]GAO04214.1 putative DNA endonuclease SmrA [Anaeromyxobacter sp. PSR-1]